MAWIIVVVLLMVVISQSRRYTALEKQFIDKDLIVTNLLTVGRWCAFLNCARPLDIEMFCRGRRSEEMQDWQIKTGKNVLVIDNFREYMQGHN